MWEVALSLNLDSEKITIACPHCSVKFDEMISRLKYEPKLSCPHCKKYIGVNLLELHAALESVRKSSNALLEKLMSRTDGKSFRDQ
ncbi:MAG: hypothetical protein BGO99_00930 [Nitrosospira sp. 56-18]|nr:MAG: hypothetical protein BGO99_00930 [Nitrosospira sp. 56-18]